MKFVLLFYGTRGDVEPGVAVARELVRRGHDVCMAVSPDLVDFAASSGATAVPCGPDAREWQDVKRDFWARFLRKFWKNFWRIGELKQVLTEDWRLLAKCWNDVSTTLKTLAEGADLLFTGVVGEEPAGNVAEYYHIPLATLHVFPIRANGQLMSGLPARFGRALMRVSEWFGWPMFKPLEDPQRRELGLPKATAPSPWRIAERGSLEIQAYDQNCFPGLPEEWAELGVRRPLIGALTMDLPTESDEEVAEYIAAGTPPICFGFGSMAVESAADTLAMISGACAQLGERGLVCAGGSDFSHVPDFPNLKVVSTMNYAAAFPRCRAVVHHGGAGTTAASLRAGIPTLVLSTDLDQTLWGARVKKLGVGTARRFSATTEKSLVADIRTILEPQYLAKAREACTKMKTPAESITAAADLLEEFARVKRAA